MPFFLMTFEPSDWHRLILAGELLITIGAMALVFGHCNRDRLVAVGVIVQGMVMLFVAGAIFVPQTSTVVAAIAILVVFLAWCLGMVPRHPLRSPTENAAESAGVTDEGHSS